MPSAYQQWSYILAVSAAAQNSCLKILHVPYSSLQSCPPEPRLCFCPCPAMLRLQTNRRWLMHRSQIGVEKRREKVAQGSSSSMMQFRRFA